MSVLGFRYVLSLVPSGTLASVTFESVSHPGARLCGLVLKVVDKEGVLLV